MFMQAKDTTYITIQKQIFIVPRVSVFLRVGHPLMGGEGNNPAAETFFFRRLRRCAPSFGRTWTWRRRPRPCWRTWVAIQGTLKFSFQNWSCYIGGIVPKEFACTNLECETAPVLMAHMIARYSSSSTLPLLLVSISRKMLRG